MNVTRHPAPVITTTQADGFARWAACCQEEIRAAQYTPTDAALWAYLCTATRGFSMVTLVSMNTRQLATGHISAAVVIGFLISWLWYANSSKDRDNRRGAGVAYALGAAVGTYTGFMLAAWLAS